MKYKYKILALFYRISFRKGWNMAQWRCQVGQVWCVFLSWLPLRLRCYCIRWSNGNPKGWAETSPYNAQVNYWQKLELRDHATAERRICMHAGSKLEEQFHSLCWNLLYDGLRIVLVWRSAFSTGSSQDIPLYSWRRTFCTCQLNILYYRSKKVNDSHTNAAFWPTWC